MKRTVLILAVLLSGCATLGLFWQHAVTGDPSGATLTVVHDGWGEARQVFFEQDAAAIRTCLDQHLPAPQCMTWRCPAPACVTFRTQYDPAVQALYTAALKAHDADSTSSATLAAVRLLVTTAVADLDTLAGQDGAHASRFLQIGVRITDSAKALPTPGPTIGATP